MQKYVYVIAAVFFVALSASGFRTNPNQAAIKQPHPGNMLEQQPHQSKPSQFKVPSDIKEVILLKGSVDQNIREAFGIALLDFELQGFWQIKALNEKYTIGMAQQARSANHLMLIASHSDAHTVLKGIGLNEIWLKMANFKINEKSADGFYYGELVVDSSLIRPFYLLEIDEKTQEGIAYFKLEDKGAREIFGTIKMKKISEHEVELDFTHKQGAGVQVIECPFKLKGAFSGQKASNDFQGEQDCNDQMNQEAEKRRKIHFKIDKIGQSNGKKTYGITKGEKHEDQDL